jgi:hypothetical protein
MLSIKFIQIFLYIGKISQQSCVRCKTVLPGLLNALHGFKLRFITLHIITSIDELKKERKFINTF